MTDEIGITAKHAYIYGLVDPRDDRLRYVGKANDPERRLKCHLSKARSRRGKAAKAQWLQELVEKGLVPRLRIIMKVPHDRWPYFEQAVIRIYRQAGNDLLNRHPGGNQPANQPGHYEDTGYLSALSAAVSAHWADQEGREAHVNGLIKAWDNPERRRWLSEFNVRRNSDPEFREMHTAAIQAGMTPGACAKISASKVTLYQDPEERRLQSVRTKAWMAEHPDEVAEQIQRLQAGRAAFFSDPKNTERTNEKRRQTMKERWADPEYRRRQLEIRARKQAEKRAAAEESH